MRAFLLSAVLVPEGQGSTLRLFARSEGNGPIELRFPGQQSVFFIPRRTSLDPASLRARRKEVALRSFDGGDVDALYFASERDLRNARERLREHGVQCFEDDVHSIDRFLMERFLYGGVEIEGEALANAAGGTPVFLNPRLRPLRCRPALRVASLDIETGVSSGALYSIALEVRGAGPPLRCVWMQHRAAANVAAADDFEFQVVASEAELLRSFLNRFADEDPDLLIGWNVVGFDLRFLEQKCRQYGLPFALGRAGLIADIRERSGGDRASLPGRVVLDGPMTLRGAFYNFEDLSLETVSRELLGEGKLIGGAEDKIAEIERRYREAPLELARYNLRDAELVQEIFQKTELIELSMRRTEISGLLLDQIGQSVRAFDYFMLPRLHRKGFVAIAQADVRFAEPAPGGHVLQPTPGLYHQVITLDFRSLYPSIIRTFHIDPYAHHMADLDPLHTPVGGYRFSRRESLLPDFIGDLFEQRAQAKREGDSHLSMAIKILMNSFYGVMGSPGCRFYHPDLPNAITRTGQWLLRESIAWLERAGYRTLYGDTDSLFIQLREDDFSRADERAAELAAELNRYWAERLQKEYQLDSHLQLEYERRFVHFFLPPARGGEGGARKRYVGALATREGEVLHFTGMEVVRSDWTELAREFQRGLYDRVFRGEHPGDWIKEVVRSVRAGERDHQLVYRKRLRKPLREYTHGAPPHVQAARKLPRLVNPVRYVITSEGPMPIELKPTRLDYEHYIEKQLAPIADAALSLYDTNFDSIIHSVQLSLF